MTRLEKVKEHKIAIECAIIWEVKYSSWRRKQKRMLGLFLTPKQLQEIEEE